MPLGDYVASNTDECTATLMYAINLKQSGTVSFEYIYPDSSIVFEFFVGDRVKGPWVHGDVFGDIGSVPVLMPAMQVQNDQCQPTVEESRWMRTTEKGWEFHSVSGDGVGVAGGDTGWVSLSTAPTVPCVSPRQGQDTP